MKNSVKKISTKQDDWKLTPIRIKAAQLLAAGNMTNEEVAKNCTIGHNTLYEWLRRPEFLDKVNEYILLDERATKAGILRRALRTLESKSKNSDNDKTTELDYMKFVVELMFGKQNNGVTVAVQNNTNVQMDADSIKEKMKKYEILFSDE